MKALSLWQPWASAWLSPLKVNETRHWASTHRGLLLVHAAKKIVKDCGPELQRLLDDEFGSNWIKELPNGALIGVVNLVKIVPTETLPAEHHGTGDFWCGDFESGRFAWRRGAYRRFQQPIPYRGHQSMFEVPFAVVAEQIDRSPMVADCAESVSAFESAAALEANSPSFPLFPQAPE